MILLKRAVLAFRSGDKQVARDLLAEASEHNPENELVWLWRASAARTRSEACSAVERVLELNPENEKALKWIEKLRPGHIPPPRQEETAEARNGALHGVAPVELEQEREEEEHEAAAETSATADWAVQDEQGSTAAFEEQQEQEESEAAAEDSASYFEREEERPAAAETDDQPQSAASDAEARLAALEAYLKRGSREEEQEQEPEPAPTSAQIEGYGWGAPQEAPQAAKSEGDLWDRLTNSSESLDDQDQNEDDGRDPLLGLLDARERAELDARDSGYQDKVDGEVDEDPASEREYHDRLAELRERRPDSGEDIWESLGMAGMDQPAPAARTTSEPLKAKAAGMGFAEMGISARAAEEAHDAPPENEEGEEQVEGCFICEKLAKEQEGMCSSCRSIVDLRLHEIAPRHEGADRGTLTAALDRLRTKLEKKPTADLCVKAALTCLNLRQSNQALAYLKEACRLRPHDRELLNYYDEIESRPLILAVDDSKTVQKMISTVLEKEAYRVSSAEDGLAAIAKLDEEMPQLVLLDITMPRMDGYQVCKVITGNEHTRHIPVIMLSGKDGFFDKVKGKMAGASNYITKPFDPNELTKTVAKFIKKKAKS